MDVLSHLALPLLALLAARVPWKRAAALAPLGLLPDVDALVGPHRAAAHNLLAVALVGLAAYALARRRAEDPGKLAALAAFAYGSHLLLDLDYGVALLWPLAPQALVVHPAIHVDMGDALPRLLPVLHLLVLDAPVQFADAPLALSPTPPVHVLVGSGAILILVMAATALAIERPWRNARRIRAKVKGRRQLRHPVEILRRN